MDTYPGEISKKRLQDVRERIDLIKDLRRDAALGKPWPDGDVTSGSKQKLNNLKAEEAELTEQLK